MRFRPLRRLSALTGALLIGTVGLGMTAAAAGPEPSSPPSVPAPAAPSPESDSEQVSVIVMLREQPNVRSLADESSRLHTQQALVDDWSDRFGIELDRQFGYLLNGFSATMPREAMSALSLEPEVASVRYEQVYERTEHTARDLHGVPGAFADHDLDGEGMVISIVDSGLDPEHPDMRLDDCEAAAIQDINEASEAGFTCKIPTGYNYADENYVIKDSTVAAHGQHVAGIAAANGSEGDQPGDVEETGRIDGAAPNAQLLAMKVFSDSGDGAASSDIIAAIEDSVKLDADVINLSLGSPNGHKNASDATSLAIEAARDAGAITVIAAGNDGQNFSVSGVDDDALGLHDDGTVASPGTQGPALTVASIDNSVLTQLIAFSSESAEAIPYSLATGSPDDQERPLIDLGLATDEEAGGMDLDGAYALIERGEITFTEKYENAIAAGAGGVVVFNNEAGTFGMAGVEEFTIPGIVIDRDAGLELRAQTEAGEPTFRITDDLEVDEVAGGLQPSSFTSWGSTPSLDFEPEIAGIGGNVYSTYNDGTYGMSSGTSMASPNVAGLSALVLQHLEGTRPELVGGDRVDLATVMLMNTADVPVDEEGIPYSPRQIGAGLARVDHALDSEVIATVDGQGAAALREIAGTATFTVTLENIGDSDVTFDIAETQNVVAESNDAGESTSTTISEGSVSVGSGSAEVPAGGTTTIEATVSAGSADGFIGGWVELDSTTDDQPDLSVPFLGFAGDWNAEQIVLDAGQDLGGLDGVRTELITADGSEVLPLTSDSGELWLSPNGDGVLDTIGSSLVMMRNASDISYEILTADGEEITTLGQEQNGYRSLLGDYLEVPDPSQLRWDGANFDGTTYDPQAGEYTALPDGRYTYQVRSRLSQDHDWQTTDLPFGIDATAPEISFGALEGGMLTFTVVEEGSGLLDEPVATDAAGHELEVTAGPDGSYALEVDPETTSVAVSALDRGMNVGTATRVLTESTVLITGLEQMREVVGPRSPLIVDGNLQIAGFTSSDITSVSAAGQSVEVIDGEFLLEAPLEEGPQEITIEASDGEEVAFSETISVTYDSVPPELTITELDTDEDGHAVPDEEGNVTVGGTLVDEREDADLTVSAGETVTDVASDGSFEIIVPVPAEDPGFVLVGSDGANEHTVPVLISGRASSWSPPEITNADCVLDSAACFVPGDTEDVEDTEDGSIFTLRGELRDAETITVTPGSRVGEDGSYVDPEPISAEVFDDGTFAVDIPVTTGETHVRMQITDTEGAVRYDQGVQIYFDITAPSLQLDEPTLTGGTLYAPEEDVTFEGTASDDGWGYTLRLNDDVVIERFDLSSPGEASNIRDFSTEVAVADEDTLLVEFYDANGNVLLGAIPVVLDTVAPLVSIDGAPEGEAITDGRELTVSAEDDNLASLTVMLDGEVISEQSTSLSSQEHTVEEALVDLRDLDGLSGEDGAESVDVQSVGTLTETEETRLEAMVPTDDLAPGEHTLFAISTDLAGNTTTEDLLFSTEPLLELGIEGPEEISLEIYREALGDQDALKAEVLDAFAVTLGGDEQAAVDAGAELDFGPGTVLLDGEQTVTVVAIDDEGRSAAHQVTVTIDLEEVTLTDGDVTATSTFRSDDSLTAAITEEGGERVLTISNREQFTPLPSVITAPGAEGDTIVRVLPDGTGTPVAVTADDGTLSFEGPSKGTYRLLPVSGPGDGGPGEGDPGDGEPGDGGGDPGDGGEGEAPGNGSGGGGEGPGSDPGDDGRDGDDDDGGTPGIDPGDGDGAPGMGPGDGGGTPGADPGDDGDAALGGAGDGTEAGDSTGSGDSSGDPMARTGVEAYAMAIGAATLIIAGGAALVIRRRH